MESCHRRVEPLRLPAGRERGRLLFPSVGKILNGRKRCRLLWLATPHEKPPEEEGQDEDANAATDNGNGDY